MSYDLKVIKDYPVGFWKLDETSGTTAADSSGCGNNGTYIGGIQTNLMPLVSGGIAGSIITNTKYITLPTTKDYYGNTTTGGFGNKDVSDNDFSLEIWIYPKITTTNLTTIFADTTNDIGIYIQNGNLIFKVQTESIEHTISQYNKTFHIIATYKYNSIALYLNGMMVSSKSLYNFKFTNSSTSSPLSLQIGPTSSASDSFIVDAPAAYRYALTQELAIKHFNASSPIIPLQVVTPDEGELFVMSDMNIPKIFEVRYPIDHQWSEFYDANLYYDKYENSISLISDTVGISKSAIIYDKFTVPSGLGLVSSKVEWDGTTGVTIETSTDGITYTAATNGRLVNGYRIATGGFNSNKELYIKITLSTTDSSRYIPRLYSLKFSFYTNKVLYALNGGSYIEPIQPTAGTVDSSIWDYDLGSIDYPLLSRNTKSGIKPYPPGFAINTINNIQTVEMLFTPLNTSSENYLIYGATNHYYSWNASGVITKGSAVSAIYVNGVSRTAATNISEFLTAGEQCHIIIVFSSAITTRIWFNVKVASNTWTNAGPRNTYNYIAIYSSQFNLAKATEHYSLYTGRSSVTATENAFQITESSVSLYNKDWLVIKSI
jgi:hypothetical protein